jgi:DNA-binding MarR family transcriptional regulator
VTYLVDDLERAGLVVRRPDPADRRIRQVVATPAGRSALERSRRDLRATEDRLLGALEPQEAEQLRTLLVKVALSVDAAEPCVTVDAGGRPTSG